MSNPELIQRISARIRAEGPVDFAWFMQEALYDPDHGYYASGRARIGRSGDFFTNVSVGRLWAELILEQIRQLWEGLGSPAPFALIEQGANDGTLAHDILTIANGPLADAIHYRIVEPFPVMRERQQETLREVAHRVEWYASLAELPECCGIHFSNELLDAQPVRLVTFREGAWRELRVGLEGEAFAWVQGEPVKCPGLPETASEGYTTEIPVGIDTWMAEVSRVISRGYILVFDYGLQQDDYYAPHRTAGTLRGYKQHQRSDDPLQDVGEKDLTTHVNWTALEESARACGFAAEQFTDQLHFVVEMGRDLFPDTDEAPTRVEQQRRRQFLTLMHPTMMGRNFQVMRLRKGA